MVRVDVSTEESVRFGHEAESALRRGVMTRAETTKLGLQLLGAIGCGAGVSAALIAVEAEDVSALWAAGRIIGVGVVALLAARAPDEGPPTEPRTRRKPST